MAKAKAPKKLSVKDVKKQEVLNSIKEMYESLGFVVDNGTEYGMTNTTLILKLEECDIQVKVVAPGIKNGERYTKIEE